MNIEQKYTGFTDPTWQLNEMQQLLVPYISEDVNVLVSAPTGSGKSTAANMYGADVLEAGGRLVYVGSFKALTEEKKDDWNRPGHPWEKYSKTSISGDYEYDAAKLKEIQDSQIITITPESLLSLIRNSTGPRSGWLNEIGVIILDEIHLVAEEGRGAYYEVAVMELLDAHPHIRAIAISGTLKNHKVFAEWLTRLNKKKTETIISTFRPVPIEYHFLPFTSGNATITEAHRYRMIQQIITSPEKQDQKFMVCFFKKTFGKSVMQNLKEDVGIETEFYSGDIRSLDERNMLAKRFKSGSLRVIGHTTAVGTGINWPARNMIITAVTAGGADVPAYTLQQIAGRAGRPGYDDAGDVYILADHSDFERHVRRIKEGEPINSQMVNKNVVATHFLGAVYMNNIRNLSDFNRWYSKSLGAAQADADVFNDKDFQEQLSKDVVNDLKKRGMLQVDSDEVISLTQTGKITAQMLLDPYDFFSVIVEFNKYFALTRKNDIDLAIAIGSNNAFYKSWISKEATRLIPAEIRAKVPGSGNWEAIACVYKRLKGEYPDPLLQSGWWAISQSLDRYKAALVRVCNEVSKWVDSSPSFRGAKPQVVPADTHIELAFLRVKEGLADWDKARIRHAGVSTRGAKALKAGGIETLSEARRNLSEALQFLKKKDLDQLKEVTDER